MVQRNRKPFVLVIIIDRSISQITETTESPQRTITPSVIRSMSSSIKLTTDKCQFSKVRVEKLGWKSWGGKLGEETGFVYGSRVCKKRFR